MQAGIVTPEKKAIVISVSDYDKLEQLDFCKNDGVEMCSLLVDLGYDIPKKRRLVGRVQHTNMRDEIINFFLEAKPHELLLFYFSGHGVLEEGLIHFLASSEIDENMPSLRGVNFDELKYLITMCRAKMKILVLDCCYSGGLSLGKDGIKNKDEAAAIAGRNSIQKKLSEGEGLFLLASSLGLEKSYPMPDRKHSAFTYYLLEGLRGADMCVNDRGFVTPELLGKYVDLKIAELPDRRQKPIRKTQASGDIALAYYPKKVKASYEYIPHNTRILEDAMQFFLKGDYERAADLYEKLVQDPTYSKALYNRGVILAKSSRFRESIEYFNKALTLSPDDSKMLYGRALLLSFLGLHEDALRDLNKLGVENNQHIHILYARGLSLGRMGKHEDALNCFQEIVKVESNIADVWFNMGIAFGSLGMKKESKDCFNHVLTIQPDDLLAKQYSAAFRDNK